ncbi:MAG: hypothetical protein J6A21_06200 [Lentisphaeria bacterium]|nr:hypothetical protein [Lentisphaeria bacterium]
MDEVKKSFYDRIAEKENLRYIDAHAHLARKLNMKKLEQELEAPGLKQVWLLGMDKSEDGYLADNEKILQISKEFPIFVPFAYLDFNQGPDQIDRFRDQGFLGIKAIRPPKPYDALEYMDLYQRAADLDMPILFHVGSVATVNRTRMLRNKSYYGHSTMLPRMLMAIQACVPKAKLIQGHMTWGYNEELLMALCCNSATKVASSGIEDIPWWYENFSRCDSKGTPIYKKVMLATDVTYGEDCPEEYRNAGEHIYEKALFVYFLMRFQAYYYPWQGKHDDVLYGNAAEYFPDRLLK